MARQKTSLAVLFADVSDSTNLYESLGDTGAFGQVRDCLALLRTVTETFNGRVVKTIGDGAMCVFPTADAAAQAAREMHNQISQRPPVRGKGRLSIRVGFHYGPVIEEGEDVFGDSVNIASRMTSFALSGQAITSAETVVMLSPELREITRRLDALPVKGRTEEVDVHELLWQMSSDRTIIPGRSTFSAPAGGAPCLRLYYRGREIVLEDSASFGRDAGNTVVITDPMASRRHAKIELRAGRFMLVDQSSNGTFVRIGSDSGELRLRREEMILHGSGRIAFGHSTLEAAAETVEFRCDVK